MLYNKVDIQLVFCLVNTAVQILLGEIHILPIYKDQQL